MVYTIERVPRREELYPKGDSVLRDVDLLLNVLAAVERLGRRLVALILGYDLGVLIEQPAEVVAGYAARQLALGRPRRRTRRAGFCRARAVGVATPAA